jgi:predicted phosphodiesterase
VKFTYSLASDLHVDFPQMKTPPFETEVVIIAGDTSNSLAGLKFLHKLKRRGHTVFAIDGNHEHYANDNQGRTIQETEERFFDQLGQTHALEVEDGLTIIGCNGWYPVTDADVWVGYMNDGRYAGSAGDVGCQIVEHSYLLDEKLTALKGKAIVVTHTAPDPATLNPRFDGHYSNEWYWSPLMGEVLRKHADKILIWNHGHTHAPADKLVDGVRVVCNPRGYPGENPGWKPLKITVEYGR